MADPMISVDGLTVEYDGKRVLDGVSLDIERGEVMVLLGGSGSGKTTMLRHIIGLGAAHLRNGSGAGRRYQSLLARKN